MESGKAGPPAQDQEFYYQEAYHPTQDAPATEYCPINIAPSEYSNPPPMQYQPQPPGGYQYPYQPAPAPASTVYIQPTIVMNSGFSSSSQSATCPNCMAIVQTRTTRLPSAAAWISCILLLFLVAAIMVPLCWIPFCIPSCYTVKHYCPRCGRLLGRA